MVFCNEAYDNLSFTKFKLDLQFKFIVIASPPYGTDSYNFRMNKKHMNILAFKIHFQNQEKEIYYAQ